MEDGPSASENREKRAPKDIESSSRIWSCNEIDCRCCRGGTIRVELGIALYRPCEREEKEEFH